MKGVWWAGVRGRDVIENYNCSHNKSTPHGLALHELKDTCTRSSPTHAPTYTHTCTHAHTPLPARAGLASTILGPGEWGPWGCMVGHAGRMMHTAWARWIMHRGLGPREFPSLSSHRGSMRGRVHSLVHRGGRHGKQHCL